MKRKIIEIDRERCTGSGQCIPDCSEGAICVVEQEAEAYDERAVMGTIAPQGDGAIWAHLEHLLGHGETDLYRQAIGYLRETCIPVPAHRGAAPSAGCPGSAARVIERRPAEPARAAGTRAVSKLRQWPIQIRLLNPAAAYFDDADLLVAADCAPFACAGFPTSSGPAGSWSSSARSSLGISRSRWRGRDLLPPRGSIGHGPQDGGPVLRRRPVRGRSDPGTCRGDGPRRGADDHDRRRPRSGNGR